MADELFRPMLACEADLDKLVYPLLASAKLDGVRAIVRDGVVYSRSNKPIPNKYVQCAFGHLWYCDGELIVGEPTAHDVYRQTTSHVMSHDKADFDLRFYVFDHIDRPDERYQNRLVSVNRRSKITQNNCAAVTHVQRVINTLAELLTYESEVLDLGYEGLILRDPDAPYKNGRSTIKEGYLLKLKRFSDNEYRVVGFEERQHNGNEATTNELGRTKRSSHAAGKTGRGDLGALVLQGDEFTFNCGTGFTDAERADTWQRQDHYLGKLAKVKHFQIGAKDKPRHPVFLGWRAKEDV